jgi:hypothetical protein
MNFDLVDLSPRYTKLMYSCLDNDFNRFTNEKNKNKIFCDWKEMTLKPEFIHEIQDSMTAQYEGNFIALKSNELTHNTKMKLINQ